MLHSVFCTAPVKKTISPLSQDCRAGRKRICKITGDRKLCARMASMGVFPGEEITLLCGEKGAQCLFRIADTTISLDAAASENILVESL